MKSLGPLSEKLNDLSYSGVAADFMLLRSVNDTQKHIECLPRLPETKIPTNCNNCGAPLNEHKCKYCGTEY